MTASIDNTEQQDKARLRKTRQAGFGIAILIFSGAAAVLWAAAHYGGAAIPPNLLLGLRWAAVVALAGYAFFRRSLTIWIFAGMIIGVEIGHDWPRTAANLQ